MQNNEILDRLQHKGVKPTANRIIIYKVLSDANHPLSLADLENKVDSIDKSSIFRVLTLFADNDVVHSFSDGRGVINYELCTDTGHCHHDNDHVHFYCENCHQSFCFEDIHIPEINLSEGFNIHEVSIVIKGTCPECSKKHTE